MVLSGSHPLQKTRFDVSRNSRNNQRFPIGKQALIFNYLLSFVYSDPARLHNGGHVFFDIALVSVIFFGEMLVSNDYL